MKQYQVIIEFVSLDGNPPVPFFECTFQAPEQEEARRFGAAIAALSKEYKILPPADTGYVTILIENE